MPIHQTAVVDKGAELGKDVLIGAFAYVQDGVVIGDETVIGPHATILRHTTLGRGCRVHAGAMLGDTPQDMSFTDCKSHVLIGSNCVIREGVTIHRGTKADTSTEIGDDCFLMAFSHFAHNVKLGRGVVVANGALCAGYVEIGDCAFISGNCGIHQFVRIGRLVMAGISCVLTKDVPPFCMTRPLALNHVAGLNVVGMRRAGMDSGARDEVKKAFTKLYRSGLNVSQAVEEIRTSCGSGTAVEICNFIEKSQRGICGFSDSE